MSGLGAFEFVPEGDTTVPDRECPKCKKKGKVYVTSRDPVWEETNYRCGDCGEEFCRG